MKRTILIIALGVAFVGASLWLILSGGRSRRATRLKYRIGGTILSLVALTSTACGSGGNETPMVSCYDPAPPAFDVESMQDLSDVTATEVRNGDGLWFNYQLYSENYKQIKLVITDMENYELQSESYELKYGGFTISLTVGVGEYTGQALLWVYRVDNNGVEEQWEEPYKLNVVAADKE